MTISNMIREGAKTLIDAAIEARIGPTSDLVKDATLAPPEAETPRAEDKARKQIKKGRLVGAAVGAAVGAGVGAAVGSRRGALVGALLGALEGRAVGQAVEAAAVAKWALREGERVAFLIGTSMSIRGKTRASEIAVRAVAAGRTAVALAILRRVVKAQ